MTIFGPDISSYQHGVNLRALPDPFVLMKCTEDVRYVDADYPGWLEQAKAVGKIPVAYHFIGPSAPADQAKNLAAHIIDPAVAVMVDFEDEGAFHPTLKQLFALIDAISSAGLRMKLAYLPHWKWSEMGSPPLTGLDDRKVGLVSSVYPGGSGYPGDEAAGWQPYGGVTPTLYQFTDSAVEGGQSVGDMNAYRGTIEQFSAFLSGTPAPDPTPPAAPSQEDDMPAFASGEIRAGAGAQTVVVPPPANAGAAGWGNVWFSLASDFGDAHVRIAAWVGGKGWVVFDDVTVPSQGGRVSPWNGPIPADVEKISISRGANPDVPLGWLIEAAHR